MIKKRTYVTNIFFNSDTEASNSFFHKHITYLFVKFTTITFLERKTVKQLKMASPIPILLTLNF